MGLIAWELARFITGQTDYNGGVGKTNIEIGRGKNMTYIVLLSLIMVACCALIYYGGSGLIHDDDQLVDQHS